MTEIYSVGNFDLKSDVKQALRYKNNS